METKDNLTMARVVAVIAILALLLGIVAVGLNRVPGPEGKDGYTPIKGIDYRDGKDGKDGIGIDGKDAPINQPPTISLVSQSGDFVAYVPTILNSCKYTYRITIRTEDSDDSNLKVTFYHSWNSSGPWTENAIFFGGNGDYSSMADFKYNYIFRQQKTAYWIIESWDGSDFETKVFSYTVKP